MGVDLRIRPSGTTSIAASLHPDFGQVEADPSQVNLTTFETFLPEQRPLFVEGSETFQFDESLAFESRGASFAQESPFYTRRIGRPPVGPPRCWARCAPRLELENGWSGGLFQAWTGRSR